MSLLSAAVLIVALYVAATWQADIAATPADYKAKIAALEAGDVLTLQAGDYAHLILTEVRGTAAQRITIQGVGPATKIVNQVESNTVELRNCQFLTLSNMLVDSGERYDGLKAQAPCNDITIEKVTFQYSGTNQQVTGINVKANSFNWLMRDNVIAGFGTGVYLGNSDGTLPLVHFTFERNLVTDCIGYCFQLKHEIARNTTLPAVSKALIRYNVFAKGSSSSTGTLARPNVLVGGFPQTGNGSQDFAVLYGNLLVNNPTEQPLFQGTGNIDFHHNALIDLVGTGNGVTIREHNSNVPGKVRVYQNTVVVKGRALHLLGADSSVIRTMSNNAFGNQPNSCTNCQLFQSNTNHTFVDATALLTMVESASLLNLSPKVASNVTASALVLDGTFPTTDMRDFHGRAAGNFIGAFNGPSQTVVSSVAPLPVVAAPMNTAMPMSTMAANTTAATTQAAVCGNGVVEGDEQCDDKQGCCSAGCKFLPKDSECRPRNPDQLCDVADTCSGDTSVCQDLKKPANDVCQPANFATGQKCKICDGEMGFCTKEAAADHECMKPPPTPAPTPPLTTCGNDVVEPPEQCEPSQGACCTTDCSFVAQGIVCRQLGMNAPCDIIDSCSGTSAVCEDKKQEAGVVCKAAETIVGKCTQPSVCDGTSGLCQPPANSALINRECNDGNMCTAPDKCNLYGDCVGPNTCACTDDFECDDKDPCTVDACVDRKCTSRKKDMNAKCDDRDDCTIDDRCQDDGVCRGRKECPDDCNAPNGICCGDTCQCDSAWKGEACDVTTACAVGAEGCPCTPGRNCDAGLMCECAKDAECTVELPSCVLSADDTTNGATLCTSAALLGVSFSLHAMQ